MDPNTRGNVLLAAELVKEGISAAKAGRSEEAREVLIQAVALDDRNLQGWLWLSGVVENLEDREVCLENVLTLDPEHAAARQGLEFVRREIQTSKSSDDSGSELGIGAPAVLINDSPTLDETLTVAAPEKPAVSPSFDMTPPKDAWENEFLCPYCATITAPEDRYCPSCHQSLRIKLRRRQKLSGWLRFAIILQAFSTVGALVPPLVILAWVADLVNIVNPFTLLPAYVGLADPNTAAITEAALTEVQPFLLIGAFIPFIFSLLMLIGLMQRWKVMYYVMLIGAILSLVSSIAGVVISGGSILIPGIIGVIYALIVIFIVFQMEDDFLMDERRVVMRVNPSAKNGMDFLKVGREYMQQRMWALAVIHLRRAAGRMPEMIDTHLALAASLMNLKHYEEAARALEDARRVNTQHPGVQDLQKLWDELAAKA